MTFSQKNSSRDQNCQANAPIGIFDSGIGGLSVANAISEQLPFESFVYYGDTAHLPYGSKPLSQIRTYCQNIAQFLIEEKQVKTVVVACNTASAAAIDLLRAEWPGTPFVGMEPAVKPGATKTLTGKVGVLATEGTFSSKRYTSLTERFAQNVEVWENPCIGLVEQIEKEAHLHKETQELLQSILYPMLEAGVDTFVLGCTHYPFVTPLIRQIIGPEKLIINPAPAVARQLQKVLTENGLLTQSKSDPSHQFFTSGAQTDFNLAVNRFFRKATVPV